MSDLDRTAPPIESNATAATGLTMQTSAQINKSTPARNTDVRYLLRLVPEPKFLYIDPSVQAFTGCKPDDFYTDVEAIYTCIHPEDRPKLDSELEKPTCEPITLRWLRKDGSILYSDHRLSPICDPDGKLIGVEGHIHALDPRTQLESSLQTPLKRMTRSTGRLRWGGTLQSAWQTIGEGLMELSQSDIVLLGEVNACKLEPLWWRGMQASAVAELADGMETLLPGLPLHSQALFYSLLPTMETEEHTFQASLRNLGCLSAIICTLAAEDHLLAAAACLYQQEYNFQPEDQTCLVAFSQHAAVVLENARLQYELEKSRMESILALARTMDARDSYISVHGESLVWWCEEVGKRLAMPENELDDLRWAALLHDIGKIGVPDSILTKPSGLNDDEWYFMRKHPEIGTTIISSIQRLQKAVPIIRSHHEHFDGRGYPRGLSGEEIPLSARILAVADAFCAMIDHRVYRPARSASDAAAELGRCAGSQFDPRVVKVFLEVYREERTAQPSSSPFWGYWQPAPYTM